MLSVWTETHELGGSERPDVYGRGAPCCPEPSGLKAVHLSHWQALTPRLPVRLGLGCERPNQ